MPNTRLNHKTNLQAYLASIQFNSVTLPVFTTRNNVITQYPYLIISSANLTPNQGQNSLTDTGTYTREYGYSLYLVQKPAENNLDADIVENNFDELEDLLLDKLQSREVRDSIGQPNQWQDLTVTDITSPYSDTNIELNSSSIIKRINLKIQQVKDF